MVVRKKTRVEKKLEDSSSDRVKIAMSSKLQRVREAITQLPEGETKMATPKSKSGSKPAAKSAKSSNGNGKSAAPAATEGTSLADICKELKMEPRAARRKLRNAEFEAEGGRYVFTRKADVEKVKKILAGGE